MRVTQNKKAPTSFQIKNFAKKLKVFSIVVMLISQWKKINVTIAEEWSHDGTAAVNLSLFHMMWRAFGISRNRNKEKDYYISERAEGDLANVHSVIVSFKFVSLSTLPSYSLWQHLQGQFRNFRHSENEQRKLFKIWKVLHFDFCRRSFHCFVLFLWTSLSSINKRF